MGRINTGGAKKRTGDNIALASSVSGTTLKLNPPKGYYDGVTGTVNITDADFVASKIIDGVNLFGVNGDALAYNSLPALETFTLNTSLIQAQTTVENSPGIYCIPNEVNGAYSSTFTGITNGFYLWNDEDLSTPSQLSYIPYFSPSYGRGGGLYMQSVLTGEEVLLCNGDDSESVRYRSILALMVAPTTLLVVTIYNATTSQVEQSRDYNTYTVSKNFFKSGIRFRDRITFGCSNTTSTIYRAQTKINSIQISKF